MAALGTTLEATRSPGRQLDVHVEAVRPALARESQRRIAKANYREVASAV
jgi:hypothetical protein